MILQTRACVCRAVAVDPLSAGTPRPRRDDFPTSRAILDHAGIQLSWSWCRRDREARNREIREPETGTDFDIEAL